MFRKIIALALVIAFSLSIVSTAYASEVTDFSEEALRVSDEYVAKYPNGVFNLSSVAIETNEYSGRTVIKVLRQGGSAGKISVNIKAIDVTATYGKDYKISIPGFLFDKAIDGGTTTPAAISVADNSLQSVIETGTPAAISVDENTAASSLVETTPASIDLEILPENQLPQNTGLKAVRQQATGKASDRAELAAPSYEEKNQIDSATLAASKFYSEAPGTEFSLDFKDGERVKTFNLDIINDGGGEAQEQLIFVITGVTGQGVIGLQKEATVNIIDDEPYEKPVFGFSSSCFTAGEETAEITLTRSAGVNYYAGGKVETDDDSAREGYDYTGISQKILFVPGQTELKLNIPVVKNEGVTDKYFNVNLVPDNGCILSGSDTVQVKIPVSVKDLSNSLLLSESLEAVPEGEMLGREKDIIDYKTLEKVSGDRANFFVHSSGWYEININGRNSYGIAKTPKNYYLNNIQSIKTKFELFSLGYRNGYNAAKVDGILCSAFVYDHFQQLAYGKNKSEITYGKNVHILNKQIYPVNFPNKPIPECNQPSQVELKVSTPFASDKAALRIYNFEINYKKFTFDIKKADPEKAYEFDFSYPERSKSYDVTPGEIDITDSDGKILKGFYTSEDITYLKIKLKNVRDNYHLTGVRFIENNDNGNNPNSELFEIINNDTIVITPEWISKYAKQYTATGYLIIQPVFERNKASLTVKLEDQDKDKGEIISVINEENPKKTYTKDPTGKIDLHVGDKVTLTGVGKKQSTVAGYSVVYNDGPAKSESGPQDAGIYTITLKENVTVSPIFGAVQLNIKRDPDNAKQFPNIHGTITYGAKTSDKEVSVNDIKSGQIVDFISIPPKGYTTMWANRTGDTKTVNGILDEDEITDPATGKLYRQYDYDSDDNIDSEYDTPLFGDLFSCKINQPNPLYYYYYTPLSGQTLLNEPTSVAGYVKTRQYSIRQGFTQTLNAAGEKVDKYVPVVGAGVKMGGSYDWDNPEAQLGYGTATDNLGRFDFSVNNVIKNAYYMLSVDYMGVSYVDKINPSVTKHLILPTFTSMKPISIDGTEVKSSGGTDKQKIVDGSVISLKKDASVKFTLTTASLENNVKVAKAVFSLYSKDGTLLSEKTETVAENISEFTTELNSISPGAKLKVKLNDQFGNESMEFDSGFEFRPPLHATSILPSFAAPNHKTLPIVESVMGALDMGLANFTNVTRNDDTYTLYLGYGHKFDETSKELKNTIDEAESGSKDAKKKLKEKNKNENSNEPAPKKKDSKVKVKSTVNNNLSVNTSLKMTVKYDSVKEQYYFGNLMMMVTLEDTVESQTRVVLPIGLSVILKLSVGGSVTGFIYIEPYKPFGEIEPVKVYADQYGSYPYYKADPNDSDRKFVVTGGVILEPVISLTVGAEYGVAEVEVNGTAYFQLVFKTNKSGYGTVSLEGHIKVTSLGFEVYSKTFGSKDNKVTLFGSPEKLTAEMLKSDSVNQKNYEPISRDYLNNRSNWLGEDNLLKNGGEAVTDFNEKILMQGIYPYPDPQLMRIDEDSLLMVFLDDHSERTVKNRGAIYYSVSHDNGATFSKPVLIDNDGTLDSEPYLKDVGDRILCLYSSLDSTVTDNMSMEDILEQNSMEMAVFNKSTYTFEEPVDVTRHTGRPSLTSSAMEGDYYSENDGRAIYDRNSGLLYILYTKTDHTSDSDELLDVNDLFDNYRTVAYRIYDTHTKSYIPYEADEYPEGLTSEQIGQWDSDWYGQRFLETEITNPALPGGALSDPLIFDLTTAETTDKGYIAYTVDMDGNHETLDDRDIYVQTLNFADRSFSKPIKAADLHKGQHPKTDGKPRLIQYDGSVYLFYNADTAIHYYNLDMLFEDLAMNHNTGIENSDYRSLEPGTALKYNESNLPTDDYNVIVGDDGKMYLVWTEETQRYADGVEPGSQEALKTENIYHEDQIYASVLYDTNVEKSEVVENTEVSNHYGRWSEKVQITAGPGSYDSPGLSIMADGKIILAAKKSEKVILGDPEISTRIENPNNAQLVTATLTPVAKPEMKKDAISFEAEYPVPGEIATIKATVKNHGLIPVLKPAVDFYEVRDGADETHIGSQEVTAPIYGGCEASIGLTWKVPENIKGLKVVVKLRGEGGDTIALAEKEVPVAVKLEYGLFNVEHMAGNLYRTYIEIHNKGNEEFTSGELVINRIDSDKGSHELKRINVRSSTANSGMIIINEGFDIPKEDLKNGCADIEVRIEKDGNLLVTETGEVEKIIPAVYKDIIDYVSEVKISSSDLTLVNGAERLINADVGPAAAKEMNNIVYVSSDPSTVSIDGNGKITALKEGIAVISAYAVPKVDITMQTQDGYRVAGDILMEVALEDCKSDTMVVSVYSGSNNGNNSDNNTDGSGNNSGNNKNGNTIGNIIGDNAGFTATLELRPDSNETVVIAENGYKVEFKPKTIKDILKGEQKKQLDVSVKKLDPKDLLQMYSIEIKQGDSAVTQFNEPVKFSIPYQLEEGDNPNAIVVYSVNEAGELKVIPNGRYKNGTVSFSASKITNVGFGYNLKTFKDVDKSKWYSDAVEFIAARGISGGVGNDRFAPQKLMTREEFAAIVVSTFGLSWSGEKAGFKDVAEGSWYERHVGALYEAGLINGTGNGNFGTGKYISRQDMANILYGAIKKSGTELNKVRGYAGFADESNMAGYSEEAVKALYEAGIIAGTGNNKLSPKAYATRANMAAMIKKVLEQ